MIRTIKDNLLLLITLARNLGFHTQTMDGQVEKVYVAIGNDLEDGLGTLEWTLRKWPPYSLHIVIIYSDINNMGNNHHVLTPCKLFPHASNLLFMLLYWILYENI